MPHFHDKKTEKGPKLRVFSTASFEAVSAAVTVVTSLLQLLVSLKLL